MKTPELPTPQSKLLRLLTAAAQEFFLQVEFEAAGAQQVALVVIPQVPAGDRLRKGIADRNSA